MNSGRIKKFITFHPDWKKLFHMLSLVTVATIRSLYLLDCIWRIKYLYPAIAAAQEVLCPMQCRKNISSREWPKQTMVCERFQALLYSINGRYASTRAWNIKAPALLLDGIYPVRNFLSYRTLSVPSQWVIKTCCIRSPSVADYICLRPWRRCINIFASNTCPNMNSYWPWNSL